MAWTYWSRSKSGNFLCISLCRKKGKDYKGNRWRKPQIKHDDPKKCYWGAGRDKKLEYFLIYEKELKKFNIEVHYNIEYKDGDEIKANNGDKF